MDPKRCFLILCLACFSGGILAQGLNEEVLAFNQQSLQHQRTAMLVLGGWAVANIGGGLALRANTSGSTRHFHEMNALWNGVNLAIAGFGYLAATNSDPASWDLATSVSKHHSFGKILLFNAGLDVGYVLGGLYLTERAKRPEVNQERLRGFGNAIMLQGAFLFAFDLVNYLLVNHHAKTIDLFLGATSEGIGLTLTF